MAKDQAAERAHQKACSEDAERREQRRDRVFRGEELTPDDRGEIAVDGKVVPLHHIAGESRRGWRVLAVPRDYLADALRESLAYPPPANGAATHSRPVNPAMGNPTFHQVTLLVANFVVAFYYD